MAHVTINAANSGVRGCVKGYKLRLHDRVARLAAKLDRLRVLVSAITSKGTGANKYESEHKKDACDAALSWLV